MQDPASSASRGNRCRWQRYTKTACAQIVEVTLAETQEEEDGLRHHNQPQSVAVAAAPQIGVAYKEYAVESIGAFFLTFAVGWPRLSGQRVRSRLAAARAMVMITPSPHSGGHYTPR